MGTEGRVKAPASSVVAVRVRPAICRNTRALTSGVVPSGPTTLPVISPEFSSLTSM